MRKAGDLQATSVQIVIANGPDAPATGLALSPSFFRQGGYEFLPGEQLTFNTQFEASTAQAGNLIVHGLAGDIARDHDGEIGMIAGDIVDALADAFYHLSA